MARYCLEHYGTVLDGPSHGTHGVHRPTHRDDALTCDTPVSRADAGDPAELANRYDREGADELIFLDITASADARNTMVDVVERVSEQVFIPLTVGGGIRSTEDMRRMLNAGADKVSVNTAAVNAPNLISAGAEQFGNQCIVTAIDAKRITQPIAESTNYTNNPLALSSQSRWEVYTHGGRTPTGLDAVLWSIKWMPTVS